MSSGNNFWKIWQPPKDFSHGKLNPFFTSTTSLTPPPTILITVPNSSWKLFTTHPSPPKKSGSHPQPTMVGQGWVIFSTAQLSNANAQVVLHDWSCGFQTVPTSHGPGLSTKKTVQSQPPWDLFGQKLWKNHKKKSMEWSSASQICCRVILV